MRMMLICLFAAISLLVAQDDPKVLPAGRTYRNDTGASVYVFDSEQMEMLVAKINKAWDYKLKAELCDSLLVVRLQRIEVLKHLASNDSMRIQLLEDTAEAFQELQPKWYQKWNVGFVSGATVMYLVVRVAAGL